MKALVTGGLGFIGRHLIRCLLADGHSVRVVDRLPADPSENDLPTGSVDYVQGDIADNDLLADAVRDVDVIYHLAAISNVVESQEAPDRTLDTNIRGTFNLLEAAKKSPSLCRFVFTSSCAVYGDCEVVPHPEGIATRPKSLYGATKVAGEALVGAYCREFGMDAVIIRPFNVYGTGQSPTSPYSGVITKCLSTAYRRGCFFVHGDGSQLRDFVHVSDLVDLFLEAGFHHLPNGEERPVVVNGATGQRISILELKHLVERSVDAQFDHEFAAPRDGDIKISVGDVSRAKALFGWESGMKMEDGLRRVYADLAC